MDDMGKYPGLVRRSSVFQYRKRVPEDLRSCIAANKDRWRRLSLNPGAPFEKWRDLLQPNGNVRLEITRSLQTGDRRDAERRYLNVASEISRAFEAIIVRMAEEEPSATDDDLVSMARSYFVSRERAIDAEFKGLDVDQHQIVANWRDDLGTMGSNDPLMLGGFIALASDLLKRGGFQNSEHAAHILGGYLRRAKIMLLSNRVFVWEEHDETGREIDVDPLFVAAAGTYARQAELPQRKETNPRRLASIEEVYGLYKARKARAVGAQKPSAATTMSGA